MKLSLAPVEGATWSVDHATKTITVQVRIAFWPATDPTLNPALVDRIVNDIQTHWQALYYKCYRLVVTLTTTIVSHAKDAPDDYFDVGVDTSTIGMQSHVKGMRLLENPLSDSQSLTPQRSLASNPQLSTLWSTNDRRPGVYAHELGHILGADDGYINKGPDYPKVPCHTRDIMFRPALTVSPQLVTRLVRRSGLDVSSIKCPLDLHTTSANLNLVMAELKQVSLVAHCDDYTPWSDDSDRQKPAHFEGMLSYRAGYLMGNQNAEARDFLSKLGVPAQGLTNDEPIVQPISFDLAAPTCQNADDGSYPTITITAPGITITGPVIWFASAPMPCMAAAFSINDVNTESFVPGPPLEGYFSDTSAPGGP